MKWFRILLAGVFALLAFDMDQSANVVSANTLAAAGDEFWDARFYPPGPDGQVNALVMFDNELVAGGKFRAAGQDQANRIAKWNGTAWTALGAAPFQKLCPLYYGVNGCYLEVKTLASFQGKLYAGGMFTGVLAEWDGSQWSLFGDLYGPIEPGPCYGSVNSLLVSGNEMYVGGCFFPDGFSGINQLLRWDGTTWSNFEGIEFVNVVALAMRGDDLYVSADEVWFTGASHIAKWNRLTNQWSAVNNGIPSTFEPTAMTFWGDTLIAAGSGKLYAWDGAQWSELATVTGADGEIHSLQTHGGELYVGGSFTNFAGQAIQNIAIWNGSTWRGLDQEVNGAVRSLLFDASNLYAGGNFTLADSALAPYVAKWDGSAWSGFLTPNAQGVVGTVSTILVQGTDVYAGGALFGVGTQRANGLARWDTLTQTWTPLGNTTCASGDCIAEIHSIGLDGNNMYVGGEFSQLGGVPANGLAKWDGSQWSAVGNFGKGPVDAIAVKDGLVYVGGAFDSIDEWNGQTWRRIGRLDGATNPHVNALVFWGDALYAGGLFSRVNQQAVGNLARWDGTTWTAPPGASEVFAIAPAGNRAFIAVSDAILQLKGSHLTQLGTGALVGFLDVAVGDNVVYRAGYAGLPIGLKGIEQWDGVQWQMLGSSVSPGPWNYDTAVQAIAAHGKDIYIGGMFSIVGDKPASNFAKWTNPAPTQPSLVAPKNKQEVKRQQPTLKWTGVAGATSYLVQLYADKRNGKLVLDTTVNGTQLQTPTLKPGKTYFWHVRACNANACGVWSNWRRFRVK